MIIEFNKNKDFVTVKLPEDFVVSDVCSECDEDGPHSSPDHIFRVILVRKNNETYEMILFNDRKNRCIIPPHTETFRSLYPNVYNAGNECYFYGRVDEDDRSLLYINIMKLPTQ